MEQGNLRRRGGTEDLSGNDSARLRLPAQVNVSSVAEVHRRDFINQSPRHQLGDLRVKHGAKEKECRASMVSRRHHNSSSSNEAARLPQLITARDRGSRKVGRKDNQNKRHRQGSNNFVAITPAAPERETPEPLLFQSRVVGRLYQTPSDDLFIVGKTFLVWPLFPVRDQTSSNWILSNVVPLFVN